MPTPCKCTPEERHSCSMFVFPDGREMLPRNRVEQCAFLRTFVAGDSPERASLTELPRAAFQAWVAAGRSLQTAKGLQQSDDTLVQVVKFSFIIERLQAADFLADESVLAAAAEQLAGSILHRLLEQPQQHGDQLAENVDAHIPCEALDRLTEDQCLHVLRAIPLPQLLSQLPLQYHPLGVLAHYPSVESTESIRIKSADPYTTSRISSCLQTLTTLTSLSFRPWLTPNSTLQPFKPLASLPLLQSLDLSGMHMPITACKALREALRSTPQLTSLDVSNCGLHQISLSELLPALCSLCELQELSLGNNKLYTEGCYALATHFSNLTGIKKLHLSNVEISRCLDMDTFLQLVRARVREASSCVSNKRMLEDARTIMQAGTSPVRSIWPLFSSLRSLEHLDMRGNLYQNEDDQDGLITALLQLPRFSSLVFHEVPDTCHYYWVCHAGNGPQPVRKADTRSLQGLLSTLPKFITQLPLHIFNLSMQHSTVLHSSNIPRRHAPTQLSYLDLHVNHADTQAVQLAAELSALTHLVDLGMFFKAGPGIPVPDSQVLPFIDQLSSFRSITKLGFHHQPRLLDGSTARHKYAESFSKALCELGVLRHLVIDVDMHEVDACDMACIGDAFSALSCLTSLFVGYPSAEMMAKMTPHLPGNSLSHLIVEMPHRRNDPASGNGDQVEAPPFIRPFALQATHLHCLRTLSLRSRVTAEDIPPVSWLLQHLTGLTEVVLALHGHPAVVPGVAACTEPAAVELCKTLREMPHLHTLRLQWDFWFSSLPGVLFRPMEGGLSPDPCWSALRDFGAEVKMHLPEPDGTVTFNIPDVAFQALCSSEKLERLSMNMDVPTYTSIQRLHLRPSLPYLRSINIWYVMTLDLGRAMGRALGGMRLPCVTEFAFHGFSEEDSSAGPGPSEVSVNILRHIAQGLSTAFVPSLEVLELDSQLNRARHQQHYNGRVRSNVPEPTQARNAQQLGTAITAVLQRAPRLHRLWLNSFDLRTESIQRLSCALKELPGLTRLQFSCGEISLRSAQGLAEHAKGLQNLSEVYLMNCGISDASHGALWEWLESLPQLRVVSFAMSAFGNGLEDFAQRLRGLSSRAIIDLTNCNDVQKLPSL